MHTAVHLARAHSHRALGRSLLLAAAVALVSLLGATPAAAVVNTFVRFEENAQANWTVTQQCDDGSEAELLVTVIAGQEFESPDLDDVNEFATLLIRGIDCSGTFINDFGTASADYTSSPSLQEATVSATITLRSGSVAAIEVEWAGTGPLETTINQTQFSGFVGVFQGQRRDATATGTVVFDGVTIVSGAAESADIETLQDRNVTLP
jgi:hypothetical protein